MTIKCQDCDFVVAHTRKRAARYWLCIQCPRLPGGSHVTDEPWGDGEPYMRCEGVNGGGCKMFKPLRSNGQKDMGL